MYNTKSLRKEIYSLLTGALAGYNGVSVSHAIDKSGSDRFVVFGLQDLASYDERNSIELEVNAVGPASDSDNVEQMSDKIIAALDRKIVIVDGLAFYIYRSTRNRVDGSDPHTVRYRMIFELYLYER